jgi:hypothetical protein
VRSDFLDVKKSLAGEKETNRPSGIYPRRAENPCYICFLVTTVTRRLNVIRNVPTSFTTLSIKTIINQHQHQSLPREEFGVANFGATFPAANSIGIKMKIIKTTD